MSVSAETRRETVGLGLMAPKIAWERGRGLGVTLCARAMVAEVVGRFYVEWCEMILECVASVSAV